MQASAPCLKQFRYLVVVAQLLNCILPSMPFLSRPSHIQELWNPGLLRELGGLGETAWWNSLLCFKPLPCSDRSDTLCCLLTSQGRGLLKGRVVQRVTFTEITQLAVARALQAPREVQAEGMRSGACGCLRMCVWVCWRLLVLWRTSNSC